DSVFKLAAPRLLRGSVVAADTGEPVPHARILVDTTPPKAGSGPQRNLVRADASGLFSVKPYPGNSMTITARGGPGTPLLAVYFLPLEWPADGREHTIQLKLPRGVLLSGRVVEEGTNRPVVGARVEYRPLSALNPAMATLGRLLPLWSWL